GSLVLRTPRRPPRRQAATPGAHPLGAAVSTWKRPGPRNGPVPIAPITTGPRGAARLGRSAPGKYFSKTSEETSDQRQPGEHEPGMTQSVRPGPEHRPRQ